MKCYRDYFEGDGRHHVWVTSLADNSNLVYDNHNVIYAYGRLEAFERVLRSREIERGEIRFPVPHAHCYNPEYDDAERRIMAHWEWQHFPLAPDDTP